MVSYKNLSRKSGVMAYEAGDDYIDVAFYGTTKIYRYSYAVAGAVHVERMKQLASDGQGLNSYIMKYVRFKYDR